MLAISVSAFRNFEVLGFEIKTVLCILIVLVLGWKQGILIGGASGITIGAVLGVVCGSPGALIASFAVSRNDSRNFKQIWKNRCNTWIYSRKHFTFIYYKRKYSIYNIFKRNNSGITWIITSSKKSTNKYLRFL